MHTLSFLLAHPSLLLSNLVVLLGLAAVLAMALSGWPEPQA
jgi:hypothetical protein